MNLLEDEEGDFTDFGGGDYNFAGQGISSDMPKAMLAEPDSRVREALTAEGGNFLMFVADAIHEKRNRIDWDLELDSDAEAATVAGEVTFDEVVPPTTNNKIIASQALMMTLTLGTKGLLNVRQNEHYANINLSLTEKGKTAQVEMPLQREDEAQLGEEEGADLEEASREESNEEVEEDEGSVFGD